MSPAHKQACHHAVAQMQCTDEDSQLVSHTKKVTPENNAVVVTPLPPGATGVPTPATGKMATPPLPPDTAGTPTLNTGQSEADTAHPTLSTTKPDASGQTKPGLGGTSQKTAKVSTELK